MTCRQEGLRIREDFLWGSLGTRWMVAHYLGEGTSPRAGAGSREKEITLSD